MPLQGTSPNKNFIRTDGVRTGTTVWQQAKAASIGNTAAAADTHDQDIANVLSTAWQTDGSNQPSADLPMNSKKFTGHAAATARTHLPLASQVQDSAFNFGGLATGTANSIITSLTPAITAYADGMVVGFRASANTTGVGATVLNVNSIGAKPILRVDGQKMAASDMAAGRVYYVTYNSTSNVWNSTVVPNALNSYVFTGKTITGGTFSGPTINNATIANATISSLAAPLGVAYGGLGLSSYTAGDIVYASGATTLAKLAKGTAAQALLMNAGATAPSWATVPFTKSFESAQQTYTLSGALTLAHGLGVQPKLYMVVLVCTTAQSGYSINDEVLINPGTNQSGSGDHGLSVFPDATNINIRFGQETICIFHKTTGAIQTAITPASWKLVARAWA
ncbi:hypothetical protein [Mesorhizobium sp. M0586]|uniref:hypothetical protein n=1 Tax=unclassified Mesorhizobium TaxID=325217 RepID=UPI00333789CE